MPLQERPGSKLWDPWNPDQPSEMSQIEVRSLGIFTSVLTRHCMQSPLGKKHQLGQSSCPSLADNVPSRNSAAGCQPSALRAAGEISGASGFTTGWSPPPPPPLQRTLLCLNPPVLHEFTHLGKTPGFWFISFPV